MFLQVSVCSQGGRVSASEHAGMPYPPVPGRPPWTRQTPPGPGETPPRDQPDPPGKQTPAYSLRAAGTHPTGMHSCFFYYFTKSDERFARASRTISVHVWSWVISGCCFNITTCAEKEHRTKV